MGPGLHTDMSACGKRWETRAADPAVALRLAESMTVSRPAAMLMAGRGLLDPAAAEAFLNPRLSDLSDPFALPDMQAAVERIRTAIQSGSRIAVFGDYDVDGITASALVVTVLRALGAQADVFLPNRLSDGYGLSVGALSRCLAERAPGLIVTVDCGTCSTAAVEMAGRAGVDVVVTDHHELSGPCAPARAVVNPKRADAASTAFLAGVGVAFKLCHALLTHAAERGRAADLNLCDWLDLVALGTVADVVPLVGENRILARHGLERLGRTENVGLDELKKVSELSGDITAYHIGYVLGPRLNAAGRLGSADIACELLMTGDRPRAQAIARELDQANGRRRDIEDRMRQQAEEDVDAEFNPRRSFGLVVGREGWHVGTAGLVASRLCAKHGRPAVVVAFDPGGLGRGSCRSIERLDLLEALRGCADLLESYGGHKMAAGVAVKRDAFAAFRERFNAQCAGRLSEEDLRPVQTIDAWVDSLGDADERLLADMRGMRPFGLGNPTPNWGVRRVRLLGPPRRMGKGGGHLKMTIASGGVQRDAVAFGMGSCEIPDGPLDMVFRLEKDSYLNRETLRLNVQDLRAATP